MELPLDRPRPGHRAVLDAHVALAVDDGVRNQLEAVAVSRGAGLREAFLAGLAGLLRRYGNTEVVAIAVSSDSASVRVDVTDDPGLAELIGRVATTSPITGHSPVVFSWGATGNGLIGAPGQTALVLSERDGRVEASLAYAGDLFDRATAERMAGHLTTLLADGGAQPTRPLSALAMLSDAERHELLVSWNDTATPYPTQATIHGLFAAQAARTPRSVAVVSGNDAVSYAQLDAASNRLARHLRELGAGPGTLVGLLVGRSHRMIEAVLGVLKSGAAYLPLEPSYPADRLAYMLDDAAVPVLVTEDRLAGLAGSNPATVVRLDAGRDATAIDAHTAGPLDPSAGPDDLAYVIYTSGSTGRPKGVQLAHRGVVNLLTAMRREPGLSDDDVMVGITTPAFDLSVPDLYLAIVTGARLVVTPPDVAADPQRLMALLERSGATIMQATPATWRMLVDAGWGGRPGLKALCGGEALVASLAGQLLDRGLELWNMYGPTEATVWSAALRITAPTDPVPVGPPMANTTFYVLGPGDQPVATGVPGELLIGGVGLAKGYLGRPELTAERFVPDPFDPTPGARLYRTGDLVRRRPDGTLEFLGRLDHQVKVRGFRIELGEIQAVLSAHPGVRESAVVAREDAPGDTRLVAYVVPEGAAPDPAELRLHLGATLPAYMVPSAFIALDAFPLTPNGKLDRKALPAPGPAATGAAGGPGPACIAPRTATEVAVAEEWAAVLGAAALGAEDDFFALGGHSLLAIQVVARVRERFAVEVSLPGFFEEPTVAAMAAAVDAGDGAGASPGAPPLVAIDRSLFIR